jgi:hypothetical protein
MSNFYSKQRHGSKQRKPRADLPWPSLLSYKCGSALLIPFPIQEEGAGLVTRPAPGTIIKAAWPAPHNSERFAPAGSGLQRVLATSGFYENRWLLIHKVHYGRAETDRGTTVDFRKLFSC